MSFIWINVLHLDQAACGYYFIKRSTIDVIVCVFEVFQDVFFILRRLLLCPWASEHCNMFKQYVSRGCWPCCWLDSEISKLVFSYFSLIYSLFINAEFEIGLKRDVRRIASVFTITCISAHTRDNVHDRGIRRTCCGL